jgi:hypothetical protein
MGKEHIISHNLKGIQDLEVYLNNTFQPVTPSPEFVSRLSNQIKMNPPQIAGVRSAIKVYILVVLGCGSGLLLFWLLRHILRNKNSRPVNLTPHSISQLTDD